MSDEDRQKRDRLYEEMAAVIRRAAEPCTELQIVAPEGVQMLVSGLSQVWGKKGAPGIMIHDGKYGLAVDVSVAAVYGTHIGDAARRLQKAISAALYQSFPEPVSAINIDVIRIVK